MTSKPETASPEPVSPDDARIQVFFGEATETGCRVYAQNERPSQAALPISGIIRGPFCRYANTLPVSYSFRSKPGQGGAEAWVPDPCFWTPAMPFYYQYTLEREVDGRRQGILGTIGIRRLGREGSNLRFDGRRWVLRAARAEGLSAAEMPAWHKAELAAYVRCPGPVSLSSATVGGVLLVVELPKLVAVEQELRSLRDEAAVGMVILDRDEAPIHPRNFARNLLFAQRFAPGQPICPDDWADVAICEMAPGQPWVENVSGRRVPLVAMRPAGSGLFPQGGRALCDLLQRDLAESAIPWAGYIV